MRDHNDSVEYVVVQDKISLFCNASAIPEPKWTWLFNGNHETSGIEVENFQDGTSTLIIRPFIESRFGNYTCKAENDLGVAEFTMALIQQRKENGGGGWFLGFGNLRYI